MNTNNQSLPKTINEAVDYVADATQRVVHLTAAFDEVAADALRQDPVRHYSRP